MKLAFSTNAFTRRPLIDAITAIADVGFPGVEILADLPHWNPGIRSEADWPAVAAIRDALSRHRIAVSNVNANCTFGYFTDGPGEAFFEPSLVSPNPTHRADRQQMILNTLRFAKEIGADNISITSGRPLPTVPPEKGLKLLEEALKPILETAQKNAIKVGIECEPGLLIEWGTELKTLIDKLGSPMLGANLDIGHSVVLGESIPDVLRLLKGRIWNCHIEDLIGRKHYHLIPGEGNFDWAGLKRALTEIQYDRFLTVELYTYPDRPIEAATASLTFLKKIFTPSAPAAASTQ